MDRTCWTIAVLFAVLAGSGCTRQPPAREADAPRNSPAEPRPSVALRVLVVNEPELADAIRRLRGEWSERADGELSVADTTWPKLAKHDAIDADLVVFPSRYLGELCTRDWLRPVRSNVLDSKDLDADDFFTLVRHELISWGGHVMALPLGTRPAQFDPDPDLPRAISLIVRAAPAAVSKDRLGIFFDTETMRPRIDEPPFVDALAAMAATAGGAKTELDRTSFPVLGVSDPLIAVTNSSRNAASAFGLLEWLAQPDISSQLASATTGTLPARRSLASSSAWYGPHVPANERSDLGDALRRALELPECVMVPRIPGIDEYLASLDAAVEAAIHQSLDPQQALLKAAQEWEAITEKLGRDRQRRAYVEHLGIGDSERPDLPHP